MIKAILFDLDGTLLPMDQDVFVKDYFGRLAGYLAPYGFEPSQLIDTIWQGTAAMMKNDGRMTNEERFWQRFAETYGSDVREKEIYFNRYYEDIFDLVKDSCGYDPKARTTVDALRAAGYRLILATSPIFPAIATKKRIRWAGLDESDFELVTTYENCRFTKPNLGYYRDILSAAALAPEECLMVGNDATEDMVAAELGMKVFLMPRDLINRKGMDISVYPQGDFDELLQYVRII